MGRRRKTTSDNVQDEFDLARPIHVLMRFSDQLGSIGDTIAAHTQVIEKYGAVWFGKIGQTIGNKRLSQLNLQCERGIPTYLYLAQRGQFYRGKMIQIVQEVPSGQRRLLPTYYSQTGILKYMHLWAKISSLEKVRANDMGTLLSVRSGMGVPETLSTGMAPLFFVRQKEAEVKVDDSPRSS